MHARTPLPPCLCPCCVSGGPVRVTTTSPRRLSPLSRKGGSAAVPPARQGASRRRARGPLHFRVGGRMAGPGGAVGPAAARELLDVRPRSGLKDILLINSKCSGKKATTLQTVKVPRSNVLDQVQSFLPQLAQANDELKRKMVTAPAHQFDIEHLDSETEKVIEMNVAVVELSDSDIDEELLTSEDDSESDEDDSVIDEVTVDNIKFPKQKGEKGKIEILDSKGNE
ncbi:NOP protein chaperone 1 [Serinus canaria]|nr:NOP protein chaperone 1 [Serinus canaria]